MGAAEMNTEEVAESNNPEIAGAGSNEVSGPRILPNHIRVHGKRIAKTLLQDLEDPAHWPRLKSERSLVRLSKFNVAWLVRTERETGLPSHNDVVTYWRENAKQDNAILPGNRKLVFDGDAPIAVVGPSGCGKTTFAKSEIIPYAPGPLLCIDVAHEYDSLRKVSLADLVGLNWMEASQSTKLRFCPNSSPELGKVELNMLFAFLNGKKLEHYKPGAHASGALSTWTFLLEEGHRVRHIETARHFILESRKYSRKLVAITSDVSLFASVCRLLKPPTLEELLHTKIQAVE